MDAETGEVLGLVEARAPQTTLGPTELGPTKLNRAAACAAGPAATSVATSHDVDVPEPGSSAAVPKTAVAPASVTDAANAVAAQSATQGAAAPPPASKKDVDTKPESKGAVAAADAPVSHGMPPAAHDVSADAREGVCSVPMSWGAMHGVGAPALGAEAEAPNDVRQEAADTAEAPRTIVLATGEAFAAGDDCAGACATVPTVASDDASSSSSSSNSSSGGGGGADGRRAEEEEAVVAVGAIANEVLFGDAAAGELAPSSREGAAMSDVDLEAAFDTSSFMDFGLDVSGNANSFLDGANSLGSRNLPVPADMVAGNTAGKKKCPKQFKSQRWTDEELMRIRASIWRFLAGVPRIVPEGHEITKRTNKILQETKALLISKVCKENNVDLARFKRKVRAAAGPLAVYLLPQLGLLAECSPLCCVRWASPQFAAEVMRGLRFCLGIPNPAIQTDASNFAFNAAARSAVGVQAVPRASSGALMAMTAPIAQQQRQSPLQRQGTQLQQPQPQLQARRGWLTSSNQMESMTARMRLQQQQQQQQQQQKLLLLLLQQQQQKQQKQQAVGGTAQANTEKKRKKTSTQEGESADAELKKVKLTKEQQQQQQQQFALHQRERQLLPLLLQHQLEKEKPLMKQQQLQQQQLLLPPPPQLPTQMRRQMSMQLQPQQGSQTHTRPSAASASTQQQPPLQQEWKASSQLLSQHQQVQLQKLGALHLQEVEDLTKRHAAQRHRLRVEVERRRNANNGTALPVLPVLQNHLNARHRQEEQTLARHQRERLQKLQTHQQQEQQKQQLLVQQHMKQQMRQIRQLQQQQLQQLHQHQLQQQQQQFQQLQREQQQQQQHLQQQQQQQQQVSSSGDSNAFPSVLHDTSFSEGGDFDLMALLSDETDGNISDAPTAAPFGDMAELFVPTDDDVGMRDAPVLEPKTPQATLQQQEEQKEAKEQQKRQLLKLLQEEEQMQQQQRQLKPGCVHQPRHLVRCCTKLEHGGENLVETAAGKEMPQASSEGVVAADSDASRVAASASGLASDAGAWLNHPCVNQGKSM